MEQKDAADRMLAPEVGAIFEYGLDSFGKEPATYRVDSYMRVAPPPVFKPGDWISAILYEGCRDFGEGRMQWCTREEATHVSGSGICGCLAPIKRIKVIGMVAWSEETLKDAREYAERLGRTHEMLF